MAHNFEIYPAHRLWPEAIVDLEQATQDSSKLRLVSRVKNFDILASFSKLEDLWCFDINDDRLQSICSCSGLKRLFIDGLRSDQLAQLDKLMLLEVLSLDSSPKTTDLSALKHRTGLRGLGIINFKNLHSVSEISALTELRILRIAGSMWTAMTLETLNPISAMTNLEELDLSNVRVRDKSLRGLAGLQKLKNLNIANYYPIEEVAWLSTQLKNTKCTWFEPYIDFKYATCKKCGRNTMVMLSGRGTSSLCKNCDSLRLAKHIDKFNKAADN